MIQQTFLILQTIQLSTHTHDDVRAEIVGCAAMTFSLY